MQRSHFLFRTNFPLLIVLIAIGLLFSACGSRSESSVSGATSEIVAAPGIGSLDAPITVIEYGDFQCIYCSLFAREIQPLIIEEFVRTGLIRMEWRHFPIFGEFSEASALAASCAHEQGKFWSFHDELFAIVDSLGPSNKNVDTLFEIATSVELDMDRFQACYTEERYAAQIASDFREGRSLGVTGTPAFDVGGRLLVGAHPIETWRKLIEQLTAEQ